MKTQIIFKKHLVLTLCLSFFVNALLLSQEVEVYIVNEPVTKYHYLEEALKYKEFALTLK